MRGGGWRSRLMLDDLHPRVYNPSMSVTQLRNQTKALIDDLSTSQLRVASEFLAFVKSRKLDAATLELLAISGFESSFDRGMKDIKAGRTKSWRKVRSDV
jgi:hypothetical protein